jgi:hypothetical protein
MLPVHHGTMLFALSPDQGPKMIKFQAKTSLGCLTLKR